MNDSDMSEEINDSDMSADINGNEYGLVYLW